MLNDFIGGGQIFLHKLRMLFQVVNRSCRVALLVSVLLTIVISYFPAQQLDIKAALTYQKAYLADSFDEAMAGLKLAINPKDKYSFTKIDAYDHKGLYARNIDPRSIMNSAKFLRANRQLIDFLQDRLLLSLKIMTGIFVLIYLTWTKFGQDVKAKTTELGSSQVLSSLEVRKILKGLKKASHLTIDSTTGSMPTVKDSETQHFLVTGATGSGKTNLIHQILSQVEGLGQPAIIIDQTGEMIAKYYDSARGDIIFNPLDARSKSWDFWTDCATAEELEQFSKILFSFNRKKAGSHSDPFWEQSAETIFNACVQYHRTKVNLSIESLSQMVSTGTLENLRRQLKGTEGGRYLSGDNQTTASSILSVLSTSSKPLSYLADHSVMGSFSLQQYFAGIESKAGSWLFLSTKPSARELTLPLIAALSELAVCLLMNIGINRQRRVWFIIDELASLGKMPALAGLMAEGRKYGACVLAGLQSLNQLYTHYGQYEGLTIFGQFGTNFFFRNNEPTMAKMVSSMCGNQTINRQQKNISFGANELRDGISYHETQQKKDLVEYSDLASLAVGQCYALLPEPQARISQLQTVEVRKKDKNIGFVQQVAKNNALFTSSREQPQNIEETGAMEQEEGVTSADGDVVQSALALFPSAQKEKASERLATELPLDPSPKNVLGKF